MTVANVRGGGAHASYGVIARCDRTNPTAAMSLPCSLLVAHVAAVVRRAPSIIALLALAGAADAQPASSAKSPPTSAAYLFRGVRVFDGARVLAHRDVLVRDGRIAAVGATLVAPPDAQVVDGTGRTLLPGLIDAHVHAFGDALAQALVFGVTTELDMFTDPTWAAQQRAAQRGAGAPARADLYSAGTLVTVPGGHGTEYGMSIPTLTRPDSAQAFVDARLAEGSDYIKLVLDDGHVYGGRLATLDTATVRAVVVAAHRRHKMAVAHVGALADARFAIDAGLDGLVHLFVDSAPPAGFGRDVARHGAFVVPTLSVLRSITGVSGGAPLLDDARLAPYLDATARAALPQAFPRRPTAPPVSYAAAVAAVRQLKAAGVPILAGTDASNPGTAHGASLHGELALLVEAGLTPTEALAAATSVPARVFHLADRGRIAPGLRADLVLVDGDPTTDITATRAIVGVWKGGVALDRAAAAAAVAAALRPDSAAASALAEGVVSDFEQPMPTARFGAGWVITTDAYAGGKSAATMAIAAGGAAGSGGALEVAGTVDGGLPFAWSGVMLMPGTQPMQPTDLSRHTGVSFWARGDGRTYQVMLFLQSNGSTPVSRTFVAGEGWKRHDFPFADFGTDGRDVLGIAVVAGPAPGPFTFRLDDVRLGLPR